MVDGGVMKMFRKVSIDVLIFVAIMAIVWIAAYFINNETLANSTVWIILIGIPASIVGSLIHYYFKKSKK